LEHEIYQISQYDHRNNQIHKNPQKTNRGQSGPRDGVPHHLWGFGVWSWGMCTEAKLPTEEKWPKKKKNKKTKKKKIRKEKERN